MSAAPSRLSEDLTSYDLMKTAAVLTMMCGHLGLYFFPDYVQFRVIARSGIPLWFFLIGFSNSRDFPIKFWVGALIITATDVFAGLPLLPFSILVSFIILRLTLDYLVIFSLMGRGQLYYIVIVLTAFIPFSYALFEYGTEGYLIAFMAYFMRRRSLIKDIDFYVISTFVFIIFIATQSLNLGLSAPMILSLSGGALLSFIAIYNFKPTELPKLTRALPQPLMLAFRYIGRNTLKIYVGHFVVFAIIAILIGMDHLSPFSFKII
ncbi:MAG: hypothetical protein AAFP80_00350 [Pseudomonadota bacterium]